MTAVASPGWMSLVMAVRRLGNNKLASFMAIASG